MFNIRTTDTAGTYPSLELDKDLTRHGPEVVMNCAVPL